MKKVTVLLPGGFKPPHMGHCVLANTLSTQADKVIVMVGPKEREGITREQSLATWDLLPLNDNVTVRSISENNPMTAAFNYVFNLPEDSNETVALGSSNKSDEDKKRSVIFAKAVESYKNKPTKEGLYTPKGVNTTTISGDDHIYYKGRSDKLNGQPISATTLRNDLKNGNYNDFKTNYPSLPENTIKAIYKVLQMNLSEKHKNILKQAIKEVLEEEGIVGKIFSDPEQVEKDLSRNVKTIEKNLKAVQDMEKNINR